jgi:hypothetical protein
MTRTQEVEKMESKLAKIERKAEKMRIKLEAKKFGLHKKTAQFLGLI